jgi:large subunit ribosomal protein L23
MSKNPHDIILRPVITEHASALQGLEEPQYVFHVAPSANKIEIRQAVESIFSVKVVNVNTVIRKGKQRRLRFRLGRRPNTKRAIVTLAAGQKIDIY